MKSTVFGEQGRRLMKLLVKAAGLEGRPLTKLVCTLERGHCVMFDATLIAEEEHIEEALPAVGEQD